MCHQHTWRTARRKELDAAWLQFHRPDCCH
jgi:hypothetical protein